MIKYHKEYFLLLEGKADVLNWINSKIEKSNVPDNEKRNRIAHAESAFKKAWDSLLKINKNSYIDSVFKWWIFADPINMDKQSEAFFPEYVDSIEKIIKLPLSNELQIFAKDKQIKVLKYELPDVQKEIGDIIQNYLKEQDEKRETQRGAITEVGSKPLIERIKDKINEMLANSAGSIATFNLVRRFYKFEIVSSKASIPSGRKNIGEELIEAYLEDPNYFQESIGASLQEVFIEKGGKGIENIAHSINTRANNYYNITSGQNNRKRIGYITSAIEEVLMDFDDKISRIKLVPRVVDIIYEDPNKRWIVVSVKSNKVFLPSEKKDPECGVLFNVSYCINTESMFNSYSKVAKSASDDAGALSIVILDYKPVVSDLKMIATHIDRNLKFTNTRSAIETYSGKNIPHGDQEIKQAFGGSFNTNNGFYEFEKIGLPVSEFEKKIKSAFFSRTISDVINLNKGRILEDDKEINAIISRFLRFSQNYQGNKKDLEAILIPIKEMVSEKSASEAIRQSVVRSIVKNGGLESTYQIDTLENIGIKLTPDDAKIIISSINRAKEIFDKPKTRFGSKKIDTISSRKKSALGSKETYETISRLEKIAGIEPSTKGDNNTVIIRELGEDLSTQTPQTKLERILYLCLTSLFNEDVSNNDLSSFVKTSVPNIFPTKPNREDFMNAIESYGGGGIILPYQIDIIDALSIPLEKDDYKKIKKMSVENIKSMREEISGEYVDPDMMNVYKEADTNYNKVASELNKRAE